MRHLPYAFHFRQGVPPVLGRGQDIALHIEASLDVRQRLGDDPGCFFAPVDTAQIAARLPEHAVDFILVPYRLQPRVAGDLDGLVELAAGQLRLHHRFGGGLCVFDIELERVEVQVDGFARKPQNGASGRMDVMATSRNSSRRDGGALGLG